MKIMNIKDSSIAQDYVNVYTFWPLFLSSTTNSEYKQKRLLFIQEKCMVYIGVTEGRMICGVCEEGSWLQRYPRIYKHLCMNECLF